MLLGLPLGAAVVVASIVLHGVSVMPLMNRYEARKSKGKPAP